MVLFLLDAETIFGHHVDGIGGALFRTDAASLAVFQVYGRRYRFGDHAVGTIEPAVETGLFACFDRYAFFRMEDGSENTP